MTARRPEVDRMASENEQSQGDGDCEDMDLDDFFIPDAKLWEVWRR